MGLGFRVQGLSMGLGFRVLPPKGADAQDWSAHTTTLGPDGAIKELGKTRTTTVTMFLTSENASMLQRPPQNPGNPQHARKIPESNIPHPHVR